MTGAELARMLGASLPEEELGTLVDAMAPYDRPRVVGGEGVDREHGRLMRRDDDGLWAVAWDQGITTRLHLSEVELSEVAS